MWLNIKMSFPDKRLFLLLLPCLVSAQIRGSFNSSTSILEPTPTASNISSTEEEEIAGSMLPPSVSTNPQVVLEEEEQAWSVPETYLYTGNASLLSSLSCQKSFQMTAQQGAIPQDVKALLYQPILSLTNTVNFLNLIFQASELRETSIREDIEWYHALIRSVLVDERRSLVRNALLSFEADPTVPQPQMVLWASKGSSPDISLQDLTFAWEKLHLLPHGLDQRWFTLLKSNSPAFPSLTKQVLLNDLSTLDTPKWARGATYVTDSSGVQWDEAPFLECKEGHFLPDWLLTLSMPFYGLKPDLTPEFRGLIRVDVNIQEFDINQCATGDFWFADTHHCNRTSMECKPIPRQGFRLGQYCCRCKEGYYSLSAVTENQLDDGSSSTQGCYPTIPVCVPCWPGCKQCQDGSPCWVQEDWHLRAVLLTVHGFFMTLVLISMLRVYQCRRTKPIRASGLLLLEIILFGSLLLYFPVLIIYFKPSMFRCILLRWVRLLGFTIVYGTVTLKMYRVLNVFLSCTANRVPYMSSTSVLRMLGVMVLTVQWFLCAWTVGVLQNQDRNIPLLITLTTSDGQRFRACYLDRWDNMMALAELLFLCWGGSLSSAVKAVPSAFHEPRYMGIAIHNQLLFCTVFHLLRFIKPYLHPDWMLLLFFIHIHVTITVTLGLLFFPKFLYISQLIKEDTASEMYEDEVDLQRSCLKLNNSFTSTCWSDHNLDPDDIRGELKKLYAQLEVYKTKKMENNNPHLQKKRSSRLLFGRSLIRRIVEIPESMSRQGSHKDKDTSGAGGSGKWSGSRLKTSESTRVIMRNETTMSPLSGIEKCVPVRDTSLLNSSVKNCMNKRSSVTESIDKLPLFCKSFSAQNLAVDNNFLQPVSTRVQKSFSFTERNRDHYSLSPQSMVNTLHTFTMNTKDKSFNEAVVKGEQHTGTKTSNKKQATNVPTEKETLKPKPQKNPCTSPPALLYVCPWEFASSLPSSSPVAKGGHSLDSDVDASRPKPPVSSSAPGSPYSFAKPMVHCGFSFHSTTQTLLLARGLAAKKASCKNSKEKDKGASQQTRSMSLSSALKSTIKTPQTPIRSMTCVHSKPCLVKQAVVRLPPGKNSVSNVPPLIHPCKSEDMGYENIVQCQYSGNQRQSLTPSIDSTKKSLHQARASLIVPRSTVCPWDAPNKTCKQSCIADACLLEVKQRDQLHPKAFSDDGDSTWDMDSKLMQITRADKSFCPWESQGKGSGIKHNSKKGTEQHQNHTGAEVFPCIVKQDSAKMVSEATNPTERVIYVNPCPDTKKHSLVRQETRQTDVCPWETSDTRTNHEMMSVDVYPWKSNAIPGKCSETIRSTDSSNQTMSNLSQTLTKQLTITAAMDICPWDFPEQFSCQWESDRVPKIDVEQPKDNVEKTLSSFSTAETCPWDFQESPPIVKEVYLLETENAIPKPKQEDRGLPSQVSTTKKTDRCSQAAEATDQSESITITKEADTSILQRESVPAKICLLENIALDSEQPKDSISEKKKGNTSTDQGARASRPLTRCDALCPWEMKEGTQASISDHDNNSDIFTWEEPIAEESDAETAAEAFNFPTDL